MKRMKQLTSLLLAAFMVFTVVVTGMDFARSEVRAEAAHTVWVVGDSTVSSFSDAYYYPRYGWGTQLGEYIDDTYAIQNLALSGTSSKDYTTKENYKTLCDGMKSGDVLLIGFGHNDEKAEEARYTNPNGDYQTEGSFANSLYTNYIQKAQEKGVTVVLCTPIVRRTEGEFSDSQLHITKDTTDTTGKEFKGGDYPKAIRDLGEALNIPVVDMTKLTKELYEKLTPSETQNLHAWTSSKPASVDNTHTNIYGGRYNAYLVCKTMKELNVAGIAEHIQAAQEPDKSILAPNPDYKEPEYSGELKQSELWEDAGIWKGTAFGNLGGNPSKDNFTVEPAGDNSVHLAVANNKGKIASGADGLIMYYCQVPAKSAFTLTATMTVNKFAANGQVACGLMARDDMYIDLNDSSIKSDYVAAGIVDTTAPKNCFYRKSGVLTKGPELAAETWEEGKSYDLMIRNNSDGYACTFGKEAEQSQGFDFALTSVDGEYIYVGMFAVRNVDVTFSNIKLIVDGEEVTLDNPIQKPSDTPSDTPTTPSDTPTDTPTTPSDTPTDTPTTPTDTPSASEAESDKKLNVSEGAETIAGDVMISGNAVVKDGDTVVALDQVSLSVKSISGDDKTAVQKIMTDKKIKVSESAKTDFFDVNLVSGGKIVKLERGTVTLTFQPKAGVDLSTVNVKVYHIKNNNVEEMPAEVTAEGIRVETDSFSPFVIVYESKAPATGDTHMTWLFVLLMLVSAGIFVAGQRKYVH